MEVKFNGIVRIAAVGLLAIPAFASTIVFSCGAGSLCDGNTYAIWEVSKTASSYVLEVDVQVTNSYTGNMTDLLNALSIIPDNMSSFTSASLLSHPAGTWTYMTGGLNASGCDGSGAPFICAQATGLGAPLFTGGAPNLLSFQFQINSTTAPQSGDTAHLKYRYVDANGNKVGSLGSFDVGIQCTDLSCGDPGGGGQSIVPEPSSVLLAGSGLFVGCLLRRRFRRK